MIFAVLERRLIQLLIKWVQFFINNDKYALLIGITTHWHSFLVLLFVGISVDGLVVKSIGLLTFRSRVQILLRAICKQPRASC